MWLLLAALLFRGLLPAGFMPVDHHGEISMAFCQGGHLVFSPQHSDHPTLHQCPFAAAAVPAGLPVMPVLPPLSAYGLVLLGLLLVASTRGRSAAPAPGRGPPLIS